MSSGDLEKEITQRVIKIPVYMKDGIIKNDRQLRMNKMIAQLKLIARDQAFSYTKEEFSREYGDVKKFRVTLVHKLKGMGLSARVVEDGKDVIVFANQK